MNPSRSKNYKVAIPITDFPDHDLGSRATLSALRCFRGRASRQVGAKMGRSVHFDAFVFTKGANLQGIVEMDETYFLESCKGDRALRARRLPRARGGNRGRRGPVSEQRPVLTAVARGGATCAEALPSTAGGEIYVDMASPGLRPMATPVTGWPAGT